MTLMVIPWALLMGSLLVEPLGSLMESGSETYSAMMSVLWWDFESAKWSVRQLGFPMVEASVLWSGRLMAPKLDLQSANCLGPWSVKRMETLSETQLVAQCTHYNERGTQS